MQKPPVYQQNLLKPSVIKGENAIKQNINIKIIHQNAQSATNKIDQLEILCSELNPDFLVVSEHGFTSDNAKYFNLHNEGPLYDES